MKNIWKGMAIASICALTAAPAAAQSSSGSGATDQAGSKPGPATKGTSGQTGTPSDQSGTTEPSSGASGQKITSADRGFIMEAAAGGMTEVQLGKLAAQKASSTDVKRFGQMMVDDHSKANAKLMQIARDKQVTPPRTLKPEAQAEYDKLSKLSGDRFDRAYMDLMVEDHEKDVAEFEKQSKAADDPAVKQFAASTLPTLQKHLDDAKDIHGKLMGQGPRGTSGTKDGGHQRPPDSSGTTTPPRP